MGAYELHGKPNNNLSAGVSCYGNAISSLYGSLPCRRSFGSSRNPSQRGLRDEPNERLHERLLLWPPWSECKLRLHYSVLHYRSPYNVNQHFVVLFFLFNLTCHRHCRGASEKCQVLLHRNQEESQTVCLNYVRSTKRGLH